MAVKHPPEEVERIWEQLMSWIIDEGGTIRGFCKANAISRRTVWKWYSQDDPASKARRAELETAEQMRADSWIDEIIEIVDDTSGDIETRVDEEGKVVPAWNVEHISRTRLRTDTRKWIACKHYRRRYGDSQSHEVSGPEGGPVQFAGIDRPAPVDYATWKAIVASEGRRTDTDEDEEV
jgi:hypothetical protein